MESRCKALKRSVADIIRRQDRLIAQIEANDADPEFSRRLQARFAELENDRRAKAQALAEAQANPPARDHQVELLHMIPKLVDLPVALHRKLFATFHLEIHRTQIALIRVTLDAESIEGVAAMAEHIPENENSRPLDADGGAEVFCVPPA